jgi:hypothetical protein
MDQLSLHAERRCRQRGIGTKRLSALLDNADIEIPIGGNCHLLRVSSEAANRLDACGRLSGLAAIVSDGGDIVTVLHCVGGRRGRRYRLNRRY